MDDEITADFVMPPSVDVPSAPAVEGLEGADLVTTYAMAAEGLLDIDERAPATPDAPTVAPALPPSPATVPVAPSVAPAAPTYASMAAVKGEDDVARQKRLTAEAPDAAASVAEMIASKKR